LKILVTNDDGVAAPGLWALVEELKKVGEVIVVVPDREQSGVGTSVTLHHPLRVREVMPVMEGTPTYVVEGTPSDSVIIALGMVVGGRADLIVSGINEGSNLGNDVIISGTVAAAFQGYFHGIPSIAVSVASFHDLHFDVAARIALFFALQFDKGKLPPKVLLNINVPNLPLEEIEGIEITRLGERSTTDAIRNGAISKGFDGKRDYYWIRHGAPEWVGGEGTDIWALKHNRISITPLHSDLTDHQQFPALRGMCPSLLTALKTAG
jgi:5'-nucleotidase